MVLAQAYQTKMKMEETLKYREIVDGIFLDRPNRFIAHVDVNGTVETVHVKNTGRCRELLLPGAAVRLEIVEQREMKDTGASDLSPESGNKPSGGIFVFHYLFRRGKPWYTECNESKAIKWEVQL